jgi:GDSL-like Lipase/Acylhydrolase family
MPLLMNWRRAVFTVGLPIVLVAQIITASILVSTRPGTPQQPLSIAVVGDSYTAGLYNRVVWPTLLAERTGWSVANFALPDSGFVADGQGGHAFTYQVDRAQGTHPRIVLIVGGLADTGLPDTTRIGVGAIDAINKTKLDGLRALVVGPTWYERPVPDAVRRVSDAIRNVAEGAGVPFLDALDPPWLTSAQMRVDLSGPTDQGQSMLADRIAAWLRTEVGR